MQLPHRQLLGNFSNGCRKTIARWCNEERHMALVTYARHADKTPGVAEALDLLKMGLGAIMQTEISSSKL